MKNALVYLVGILLVIMVIYGGYWVVKKVSYSLFYESMVQETVRDMVKKEALK